MATAAAKERFTTGEAAAQLGEPAWRVVYWRDKGVLPGVQRTGILRSWSALDIERARRILAERHQGVRPS